MSRSTKWTLLWMGRTKPTQSTSPPTPLSRASRMGRHITHRRTGPEPWRMEHMGIGSCKIKARGNTHMSKKAKARLRSPASCLPLATGWVHPTKPSPLLTVSKYCQKWIYPLKWNKKVFTWAEATISVMPMLITPRTPLAPTKLAKLGVTGTDMIGSMPARASP